MGFKAMWAASAVIEGRDDLDTKEAFTLTAIAKYADDNGKCFPGRKTLMTYTKLGKTATTAAIAGLVAKGLITSEERNDDKGQKSNMYTLLFPLDVSDPLPRDGSTPYRDAIAPLPPDGMPPTATRSRNQLSNQSPNLSDIKTPTTDVAGDSVVDKEAAKEQRQREKVAKAKKAHDVIAMFNEMANATGLMPPAVYADDYPGKIAKISKLMPNGGTLEEWENYLNCAFETGSDFWIDRAIFDDLLEPKTLRKVRAGKW